MTIILDEAARSSWWFIHRDLCFSVQHCWGMSYIDDHSKFPDQPQTSEELVSGTGGQSWFFGCWNTTLEPTLELPWWKRGILNPTYQWKQGIEASVLNKQGGIMFVCLLLLVVVVSLLETPQKHRNDNDTYLDTATQLDQGKHNFYFSAKADQVQSSEF